VPPRKVIAYAFQGSPAQPYGISLAMKVYWYAFFKRHTVKFWALFNERFGSPTAIARYTSTASPDEVARLESLIATLQTDSGIILPEGIQLDLLEAGRSAAGSTHRDLADWCNDEISKAVLGQTLTITEGRRSGSLSLGEVHNQVRREYTAADARSLGACLSATLLRWITDFNLGPHYPSPRMRFAAERPTDSAHDLALDERLVRLGVPLPVDWFHQRYSRPMPADGQRTLRYDDANLYQYHLQFGILRINEVRASLGLPPVPWGDGPPQSISQPAPSNQPAPGRDQTDGDPIESALDEDRNDRRAR
jgi:phage gp29-like protein